MERTSYYEAALCCAKQPGGVEQVDHIPAINILYLDATRGLSGASRTLLTLLERVDRGRFSPYTILANNADDGDLRLVTALQRAHIPTLPYRLAVLRRGKYRTSGGALFLAGALVDSVTLVARLIQKYRIDIVQSNTSNVLTGALAARIMGVPHIWHVHEILCPSDAKLFPRMLDALSTCVVTISDAVARHLLNYRPSIERKLKVIKNGIDPTPFRSVDPAQVSLLREQWGIEADEKVVATVGSVGVGNGETSFLRIAQLVRKHVDRVKFAVVGGAFDNRDYLFNELREQAEALGLGKYLIVPGRRHDIPVVMNVIDLLVQLPNRPEPFGLAAAEAMAAGKPAIVAAAGGLQEVVCDFETGFHVPAGDIETAAERAVELLTNDRLRNHMGKAGSRRVDREFSAARYVRQFEELYSEMG